MCGVGNGLSVGRRVTIFSVKANWTYVTEGVYKCGGRSLYATLNSVVSVLP